MSRPRRILTATLLSTGLLLGGCEGWGGKSTTDEPVLVKPDKPGVRVPTPTYATIVERWNDRVDGLDRLFVRANLLVDYFDEKGELQRETPEGRLQVVRPDKLALSLGKAGANLFWFGSDEERYWWLDMSKDDARVAAIGKHTNFDRGASRRLGLAIRPLDLIKVLGISPLDPKARARVDWSEDGALVVVTLLSTNPTEGSVRMFLVPGLFMPRTIELSGPDGQLEVIAEHEGEERVEITRQIPAAIGARPPISSRVTISHLSSGTQIRLTMTGAKDGPVSDKAFDFDELRKRFVIDRIVDLDAPPKPAPQTPRPTPTGQLAPVKPQAIPAKPPAVPPVRPK